jgi:hypothetical protein
MNGVWREVLYEFLIQSELQSLILLLVLSSDRAIATPILRAECGGRNKALP